MSLWRYCHQGFLQSHGYFVNIFWNAASNPSITRITSLEHYYGTRVVSYTVTDGIDNVYGFATVTVRPVPEAPIAGNDLYLTQRNTTLRVALADGVLKNDFEPDARQYPGAPTWEAAQAIDLLPFELQLLNQAANGLVTLSADGSFVYVANQNYSGLDEFRYTLRDATGQISAPGIVRIRVNTPPTPVTDSYTVNEDTRLTVPATQGLLANDTDVDGDLLFASCVGGDSCVSQLNIRADGGFTYSPPPNFYGTKTYQYRSEDPYRGFGIGTLTITVLPVNDAPVPEPDTYRVDEDNPLTVPASLGILFNDDEVDGERLVGAVVVRQPRAGTVLLQTDGRFAYTPNANSFGRETLRYRVFDESGLFAEAEVEILVDAVNDAPRAVADSYSIDQDQRLEVNAASGVLRNDSDVDSPNLSATLLTPALHGVVSLQTTGAFSYQPNGIFAGIDQFQYQLSDGVGGIASATVTINVRDLTDPIEISVTDDFFNVTGVSLSLDAPGVLANDSVTGAPSLSAALVGQPAQGLVTMASNGGFVYTAPAGFVGSTSFTYAAAAGNSAELGLVTLNVSNTGNQPPVATNEQFGMFEDGVLDSNSAGGLLVNDRDPEGSPLSLVMQVQPLHGSLNVQPNGQFVYTPALNFNGSDLFRYRVSDGILSSNVATATITVVSQNDVPVALADAYQVLRDQALTVTAPGVLGNDSDLDGDALSVELVDAPMRGQLTMAANGGFSYQPLPGVSGVDSFRYAVTDGAARALAVVVITITAAANRAPIAQGESYTLAEDQLLGSGAQIAQLIANDSDPDGDPLSVQVTLQPEHGSLSIVGPDFRYQPGANYFGTDQFSYRVSDGALSSQTVQTQLLITAVNDAPSAQADLYLMTQGGTLNVPAAEGVLANDRDIELQPLTATVHTPPSHGVLSLAANGAFLYTPSANFFGRDEFEYQVSDGIAQALGRVAIDVTAQPNQRPIAIGESFVIVEDSVLDTTQLDSLLSNDRDPEGAPLTLRISKPPTRGVLRLLSGGNVRYEPVRNDTGAITFDYVVNDGVLDSLPARVQIQLTPQNDAPMALADVYNLLPSVASLVLTPAQGVLSNDVDPDGDIVVSAVVQAPANGSLNLALNGALLYTPVAPRPQSISFSYRVRDPLGLESSAVVTINFGGALADEIFRNGFEGTP